MGPHVVVHDRIGAFVGWGCGHVYAKSAVAPHEFNAAVGFEESCGIVGVTTKINGLIIASPRTGDTLGGGISNLAIGSITTSVVVEDVGVAGLLNGWIVGHDGIPVIGVAFTEDHFLESEEAKGIVGSGPDDFGMSHVTLRKMSALRPA